MLQGKNLIMIEYIEKIFLENEYEVFEKSNSKIFLKNISEVKDDYYLIYDLGEFESIQNLLELIDDSEEYFSRFRSDFEDIDKNTTAVYLLNVEDSLVDDKLWHFFCETEEIVRFMKRNVLHYTNSELNYLETISTENNLTTEILMKLKKHELFKAYKEKPDVNNDYRILAKLFIKLNCLVYRFDKIDGFDNLDTNIKDRVNNSEVVNNSDYDYIIEQVDMIIDEEINYDEFYSDFSTRIKNINSKSVDERVDKRIKEIIKNIESEV